MQPWPEQGATPNPPLRPITIGDTITTKEHITKAHGAIANSVLEIVVFCCPPGDERGRIDWSNGSTRLPTDIR